MTSTGNPESKEAGINAVAFGMLVAFSEMDQVTSSINFGGVHCWQQNR